MVPIKSLPEHAFNVVMYPSRKGRGPIVFGVDHIGSLTLSCDWEIASSSLTVGTVFFFFEQAILSSA